MNKQEINNKASYTIVRISFILINPYIAGTYDIHYQFKIIKYNLNTFHVEKKNWIAIERFIK